MNHPGIEIIRREDGDADGVATAIAKWVRNYVAVDVAEVEQDRMNAKDVSRIALWDNLVTYYKQAYNIALERVNNRLKELPMSDLNQNVSFIEKQLTVNNPSWVSVMIHRSIPEKLMALEEISKNLWWCWHEEARELFRMIDVDKWRECGHNPIVLLDSISLNRYKQLENDAAFVKKLDEVYRHFQEYMSGKEKMSGDGVAYFSMEYGLHTSLKIYSGGLGNFGWRLFEVKPVIREPRLLLSVCFTVMVILLRSCLLRESRRQNMRLRIL